MRALILALLLLIQALPAEAARGRKAKSKPSEDTPFAVEVPTSEVDVATAAKRDEDEGNVAYELSVSTWSPSDFTRPSFSRDVFPFKRGSTPLLSLTRIAPIHVNEDGSGYHWRAGLSYGTLERKGLSGISNALFEATQKLSLVSVVLGAEYRAKVLWNLVQPFAFAELRPSYLLGPRSTFEEPVNEWGLPFNAGAGVLARPAFLQGIFGLGDGALGLSGHYMFGSIDASSMAGFGAQAFVQIVL